MEIERINTYADPRFSSYVLRQHGCFLVDGIPCEVEIISEQEAVVRGEKREAFQELIDQFRFFAPHITRFCDEQGKLLRQCAPVKLQTIAIQDIQPSQFFVDKEKVAAVASFIDKPEDIIIQAAPMGERYVSVDGHTRLYYAVTRGWTHVRGVVDTLDECMMGFVTEAIRRGIHTPGDMTLLEHADYEVQWNQFCDDYFAENN